jgi:hypothetical protein
MPGGGFKPHPIVAVASIEDPHHDGFVVWPIAGGIGITKSPDGVEGFAERERGCVVGVSRGKSLGRAR